MKLTNEAVEAARIAAAFRGVTLYEYASDVLLSAANRDIEAGYRERRGAPPSGPGSEPSAPARKRKGGGE